MAKAIRIPPTIEDDIQLTLTNEEARALLWVLLKVGGSPQKTPRGLCDRIKTALQDTNIKPIDWASDPGNSVYFADRKLG